MESLFQLPSLSPHAKCPPFFFLEMDSLKLHQCCQGGPTGNERFFVFLEKEQFSLELKFCLWGDRLSFVSPTFGNTPHFATVWEKEKKEGPDHFHTEWVSWMQPFLIKWSLALELVKISLVQHYLYQILIWHNGAEKGSTRGRLRKETLPPWLETVKGSWECAPFRSGDPTGHSGRGERFLKPSVF